MGLVLHVVDQLEIDIAKLFTELLLTVSFINLTLSINPINSNALG